jgi:hypothetical protein
MFIIFNAKVIQPGDMKALDEAMLVGRTFIRLFQ